MIKRGVILKSIFMSILVLSIFLYQMEVAAATSGLSDAWKGNLSKEEQDVLQRNIAKYNPEILLSEFVNLKKQNQTDVTVTIILNDSINVENFIKESSYQEFKSIVYNHVPNKSSNRFSVRISEKSFFKLLKDDRVKNIDYNMPIHMFLDDSAPLINADDVWSLGYTGDGVKICIIDSGIDSTHSDLSPRIVDEKCYCTSGGLHRKIYKLCRRT